MRTGEAMRYNLLLFKEKRKRIFTSIGAMTIIFIRTFRFLHQTRQVFKTCRVYKIVVIEL
ncbi:hypothetical protein ASF10_01460 [Flavobacterium sp. Leaf82]|nr:hypothetical protein ASF10_01460 [Flavobacterium sp. Leaf82]